MRALKAIAVLALACVGLVISVMALLGQGLDRAEKWVSLVGMFVSVAIGLTGLYLAVSGRGDADQPHRATRRTGNAAAIGSGSLANTGVIGTADISVEDSGAARAQGGGRANTGAVERGGEQPR